MFHVDTATRHLITVCHFAAKYTITDADGFDFVRASVQCTCVCARNIAMLSEMDPQPEGRGRGHTHTRSAPFHHGSVGSCKRRGIPPYFLIAPFVTSLRPRNLTNDRMIDRCSGSALPNNASSSSVHSVSGHLTHAWRILPLSCVQVRRIMEVIHFKRGNCFSRLTCGLSLALGRYVPVGFLFLLFSRFPPLARAFSCVSRLRRQSLDFRRKRG